MIRNKNFRTSPPTGKPPVGRRQPLQQPRPPSRTRWANSSAMGSKRGRPTTFQKDGGAPLARSQGNSKGSNLPQKRPVAPNLNLSHPPRKSHLSSNPPTYANMARKGIKPSHCLTHVQPKPKPRIWQDRTRNPGPSFWRHSENVQREWIYKESKWSVVRWALKTRRQQWDKMATKNLQDRLLNGEKQMQTAGVIYVLILHQRRCVYIGQTVNSVWHRWKQHVTSKSKPGAMERQLQNELLKVTPADVSVIPLEVVPMPTKQKQGHHTYEYIEEFRRRALAREQQWLRIFKGAHSRILNSIREAPKSRTSKRRERRAKIDYQMPKAKKPPAAPKNAPQTSQKWIRVEEDRIVLDSTTPGDFSRVRKSLGQLLQDQNEGRDPLQRLTNWSKTVRRDIILFLMDQLDEQEVNAENSRVLFKFLATAEDSKNASSMDIDPLPHIDTSPQRQAKRDKAKDTFWMCVPWSRHNFKDLKLDQILQSKESMAKHPAPTILKNTRVS